MLIEVYVEKHIYAKPYILIIKHLTKSSSMVWAEKKKVEGNKKGEFLKKSPLIDIA
tara:strand:- start:350 stop:517 length:168 start_codon:yes stop_codon:yes gene_type:complete